jgi:hypothetical protein
MRLQMPVRSRSGMVGVSLMNVLPRDRRQGDVRHQDQAESDLPKGLLHVRTIMATERRVRQMSVGAPAGLKLTIVSMLRPDTCTPQRLRPRPVLGGNHRAGPSRRARAAAVPRDDGIGPHEGERCSPLSTENRHVDDPRTKASRFNQSRIPKKY